MMKKAITSFRLVLKLQGQERSCYEQGIGTGVGTPSPRIQTGLRDLTQQLHIPSHAASPMTEKLP